jgi:hypothetical protein
MGNSVIDDLFLFWLPLQFSLLRSDENQVYFASKIMYNF